MARVENNNASGKIRGTIYYSMNGKGYARKAPFEVRQSPQSEKAADRFTIMKRASGDLRWFWKDILQDHKTLKMMRLVDRAVSQWVKHVLPTVTGTTTDIPYLQGLQLRSDGPSPELALGFMPRLEFVQNQVLIHIPSFDTGKIRKPANTLSVQLQFCVGGARIDDPYATVNYGHPTPHTALDIPVNGQVTEAQTAVLGCTPDPDSMYLVAMAVRYYTGNQRNHAWCDDPKWMPAGVIGGCYVPVEER